MPRFTQPAYTITLPEGAAPQEIEALQYVDGDSLPMNTQSTVSIVSVNPPSKCVLARDTAESHHAPVHAS